MKLHKEGKKIIPAAILILILLDITIYYFLKEYIFSNLIIVSSIILAGLIIFFFRVPLRHTDKNLNHILSPCDGKVVEIKEVYEKEYFMDQRIQVSIFMSPLNVHQNFAPVSGEITYMKHFRGAFYPAFVEKSSELNERCSSVFRTNNGEEVLSRQIAGTVARRICVYKTVGDKIEQGDEYGFIRFGSRVDLFLPGDVRIKVKLNEKPVGSQTIIASF